MKKIKKMSKKEQEKEQKSINRLLKEIDKKNKDNTWLDDCC